MAGNDDARAELKRQFEFAISGMELADLRSLTGQLSLLASMSIPHPIRPELRRRARSEPVLYRIRVDLREAKPPIWRRLDIRSDVTLDVVHEVLQSAFGWTDSRLHRFSLGGGPFEWRTQLFLCPFDVEEDDPDDGGIAARDVRLDEAIQNPGDVLRYVYDYGDFWELSLRLEKVLPATSDGPTAVCVGGRRAAPPEDSGGVTTADELAEILVDPARFDVGEVNAALRESGKSSPGD